MERIIGTISVSSVYITVSKVISLLPSARECLSGFPERLGASDVSTGNARPNRRTLYCLARWTFLNASAIKKTNGCH